MADDEVSSISQSRSQEEMAEFWDTHNLTNYEDQTYEVEMTFDPSARRSLVGIEPELMDELRRSDTDLWSAARSTLSAEQRQQLEALHDKQQRVGLTPDEQTQEETLRTLYRETLLVHAQAVALLQQRGYDVSDPAAFHPLD